MVKAALLKFIDEVVGAWVCWAMTSPQRTEEDPAFDATPGRILVIRPGGIGDAVMALPMLTRLHERYPDRAIDILCESRNAGLLRLAFPAWTLLTYDSHPWRTLSALRRGRYAAVLDTEQFHSFSGVFTAWTRAPIRIGFKINVRRNALYTHLVNYDLAGREDLQFAALLSALTGEDESSRLPSKDGILRHAAADTPLPEPLAAVQRPVLIHVEGRVREKMLPDATLISLCDALGDMKGITPLLVGGAADKARAELAGKAGEYHFNCPLDRTLFAFKGVTGEEFLLHVRRGLSDEALALWLDEHGLDKTPEEIQAWSDSME
ncbi:MAG: DUF5069 domain-containing protein, partial [Kiritimatiellaeota bacterium]|nr:DUF5069 domain-containing protein [Kiritimatiellota bacterium]